MRFDPGAVICLSRSAFQNITEFTKERKMLLIVSFSCALGKKESCHLEPC